MGWSLKYPLGKNSVVSNAITASVKRATNPIGAFNKAFGTKIPDSVKIGGTSIGLDPVKQARASLKDIKNAGRQAGKDWKNAGRGEVGKFVSTGAQGVYTMTMALPRAIKTGDWEKESQRFYGGSRAALSPLENMIGKNQGWQDKLRNDKGWNDWTLGTAKNFAGQTRGHAQMESSGTLLNTDRVAWQQLSVKAGAVTLAILGGGAAAGAYSGSGSAAGAGGAGAASGAAGAGSAGLTLPTLGSSAGYGATASYGLGSTVAGSGATAAAAGGGFWSTTGTIAGTSLLSRLVGGGGGPGAPASVDIGGIGGGSDGGFLDDISDFIGGMIGGGSSGGAAPITYEASNPLTGQLADLLPATDEGKMLLWTGVAAVVIVFVWRARRG